MCPPAGPDTWFTLMAGPDAFSPDSIIDMSRLIEKPAGTHGFLHSRGKDFAFEDGTPVKFWGIDASMTETVEAQERQARFYAKHGINMIRQHPVQSVLGSLRRDGERRYFDPERLDRLDRWFSILKKNGIYMTWSIFYHHVVLPDEGIDPALYNELPNSGGGKDTYGFATFIEEYQDSQWDYARVAPEPCESVHRLGLQGRSGPGDCRGAGMRTACSSTIRWATPSCGASRIRITPRGSGGCGSSG